jgi:mannosyltransferase
MAEAGERSRRETRPREPLNVSTEGTGRSWSAAWILLAMLLAAGLRIRGLDRMGVWVDEAFAINASRLHFSDLLGHLPLDSSPPLYYLLLKGWVSVVGESAVAVRALSVLFGVLTVPAAALLAWRITVGAAGSPRQAAAGRPVAHQAAVLAGFSVAATPMLVQFSQEARTYTFASLVAVLTLERLLAWIQSDRLGALNAHALGLLVLAYTHNWGLLLLPASATVVLLSSRGRRTAWAIRAAAVIALYLPWAPVLLEQSRHAGNQWIAGVAQGPIWLLPARSLWLYASGIGANGGPPGSLLPSRLGLLAGLGWILLLAAALTLRPELRRGLLATGLFGSVPLLIATLMEASGRQVYLAGRHDVLVLPVFLSMMASSAAVLVRKRLLPGVAVTWIGLLAAGSIAFTGELQRNTPERGVATRLARIMGSGDRVIFTGLFRPGVEYYLRLAGRSYRPVSFPAEAAAHLGWFDESTYAGEQAPLRQEALGLCPGPGEREWILATDTKTCRLLIETIGTCAQFEVPFTAEGDPLNKIVSVTARPSK